MYPCFISLSQPPKSKRLITKTNPATFPLEIFINLDAASAVPPVAIKSSIIITESSLFIESLCTSMVAVPYSSLKSTECVLAGNLFFFLSKIKGY